MKEIDWTELRKNRNRLVAWQNERRSRPLIDGEVRLNVGCGDLKWQNYIGVDLYSSADIVCDLRKLDQAFDKGSVDEIVCHHVLEHIPFVDVMSTLTGFYDILKPGGVLELGMPDAELCCIDFITSNEERRWTTCENEIWGRPAEPGMAHNCGITLDKMERMLVEMGFSIEESYNYDANTVAPSLFVFARKPREVVQNIIAGTYTNRTDYVGDLAASIGQYYPELPFLVHIQDGTVGENMERLRLKFKATGIRFWLVLDDDMRFCNSEALQKALSLVQRPEIAAVSVWPDTSPNFQNKAVYTDCVYGYFILIDSHKIGNIAFDISIPDTHDYFDVDYCLNITKAGFRLAMASSKIRHLQISGVGTPSGEATDYMQKKWPDIQLDGQAQYVEIA